MRPDKMTARLQQSLADAQSLAIGKDQASLEPLHLLAVLLDQRPPAAATLLKRAGANLEQLRDGVGVALDRLPTVGSPPSIRSLAAWTSAALKKIVMKARVT